MAENIKYNKRNKKIFGGKNMQNRKFHKTLWIAALSLATFCANTGYGSMYVNAGEIMQQDAGDEWTEDSQEWNLDANGTLTITGTGNLSTWYWDEFDAKSSDVKRMVVNVRGLTYFSLSSDDFPNLESVDLSGCDGSEITDLYGAFSGLTKLKTVNFGNFNTSNVTDMSSMFSGCSSLTSLDLSKFNTSKVTDMRSMFNGCFNLSNLNLGSFNTGSVTNMNSMFYGCNSLANIDLKNWNTGSVTNMDSMFSGCIALTSLDLSGWNTGNVTKMYGMFSGCRGLRSINLNGINTGKVLDMSNMFSECSGLTSLDLKGFNTGSVTEIDDMFYACDALKEIDISNFDLSNIELLRENTGETYPIHLFSKADNLEKIKVPANLPERIVFPYSEQIPANMTEYWKDESGAECEYAKAGLSMPMTYTRALREIYTPAPPVNQGPQNTVPTALPAGTQVTDAASSGKFTVTGSDTVAYTGTTNTYAKSVNIPDSITYLNVAYKVTSVNAKALRANKQVTSVKVGANVTKIGNNAFENCTKLKSVTVGKGVTSIGSNAFKGCKNLKTIQVKTTKLKSVGKNAFKNVHKKCKIKVPASKVKAYQKKMKGKGQAKSVKVTK